MPRLPVCMSSSAIWFPCREPSTAAIALAAASRASATVSPSTATPRSSLARSGSPETEPLPVTWMVRSPVSADITSEPMFTSQAASAESSIGPSTRRGLLRLFICVIVPRLSCRSAACNNGATMPLSTAKLCKVNVHTQVNVRDCSRYHHSTVLLTLRFQGGSGMPAPTSKATSSSLVHLPRFPQKETVAVTETVRGAPSQAAFSVIDDR